MRWGFKHIDEMDISVKRKFKDFLLFYMTQRGWKFDWKIWKEIDVGTELEQMNKQAEEAAILAAAQAEEAAALAAAQATTSVPEITD